MATQSGADYQDSLGATEVLFNVKFTQADFAGNATIDNKLDTLEALEALVARGELASATTAGLREGYTEFTHKDGSKFFFVGPETSGKPIRLGSDGDAIIATFKNNKIIGGSGNNDIQIVDNGNRVVKTGGGDDTVALTGTGKTTLSTGAGNDTVTVVGNSSNKINTGAGDDKIILDSGNGTNKLTGGSGNDYFIIGAGKTGKDIITDFKKGDVLQIMDRNGDKKVDSGDILSVEQKGKDTVIKLAGGEEIVLKNVKASKLLDEDDDGTFILS